MPGPALSPDVIGLELSPLLWGAILRPVAARRGSLEYGGIALISEMAMTVGRAVLSLLVVAFGAAAGVLLLRAGTPPPPIADSYVSDVSMAGLPSIVMT